MRRLGTAPETLGSILQDISAERLRALAADDSFVGELERLAAARQAYLETPSWFSSAHGAAALSGVAYFSMEFGLGEGLPLYAGGLGILAGDFLKTASDLGIPVIGIGSALSGGLFPADHRRRRRAARGLSVQRPGLIADPAGAGSATEAGSASALDLPGRPGLISRLAGAGRARQALPARRQRPAQQSGRPRHHRQAL